MKKKACFPKEELKRGAWSEQEDRLLSKYIEVHGHGKWRTLPLKAGLNRCGKSCRMRWLNYLKPGIKRGNITEEEEEVIIRMHKLIGNRWSLIAGRIPGRTDNEIKNYWNTYIKKNIGSTTQPSLKNISIKKADKIKDEDTTTSSLKFKEFQHQIDNMNNSIIHDEHLIMPLGWGTSLNYNGHQEVSSVAHLGFGGDTESSIGEIYPNSLENGNEWRYASIAEVSEKFDNYFYGVEWEL